MFFFHIEIMFFKTVVQLKINDNFICNREDIEFFTILEFCKKAFFVLSYDEQLHEILLLNF